MEREHEALAGAAEHEALSSEDPSSPASLRYAAGVVSTQRVSSAVAAGRRALKAMGGAEGASSATARAAARLVAAAEQRGAMSHSVASRCLALLNAVAALVADLWTTSGVAGLDAERVLLQLRQRAIDSRLLASAAKAAEGAYARAAEAYGDSAAAQGEELKRLVDERGVYAAADVAGRLARTASEMEGSAISVGEARTKLASAASELNRELGAVEGVQDTLDALKDTARAAGFDVDEGIGALNKALSGTALDAGTEDEGEGEGEGETALKGKRSLVDGVGSLVSDMLAFSRDDLRDRAERRLGRPLSAKEAAVVNALLGLYDEFSSAPLARRAGDALASAARKVRVYARELEAGVSEDSELSIRRGVAAVKELWARLAEERTKLIAVLCELKPAAIAALDAAAEVCCNELLPGIALPRFDGIFDSPIGRVCYHVGCMEVSKAHFDPKLVRFTAPSVTSPQMVPVAGSGSPPQPQQPAPASRTDTATHDRQSFGSFTVPGIGVALSDFRWQFAKRGYPFLPRDNGLASVEIGGLAVKIEYGFRVEGTKLTLLVKSAVVSIDRCDVRVANASGTESQLYTALVSAIQRRLSREIGDQVALQVGAAVDSVAKLIEPYAKDVVAVAHTLELPPPEPIFVSPYHTKELVAGDVAVLDDLDCGHFLKSLPQTPRCVYFGASDEPPSELARISERLGAGMLFAFVPFSQGRVRRELGAAYVDTSALPECVLFPHSAAEPIWLRGAAEATLEAVERLCAPFSWPPGEVIALDVATNAAALESRPTRHVLCVLFTSQSPPPLPFRELARRHAERFDPAEHAPALFASVHVPSQPNLVARFEVTKSPRVVFVPPASVNAPAARGTHEFLEMPVTPRNVEVSLSQWAVPYRAGVVSVTDRNAEAFFLAKPNRWKVLVFGDRAESTPAARELFNRYSKRLVVGYCGSGTEGVDAALRARFGVPPAGPAAVAALGHVLVSVDAEKEALSSGSRMERAASSVGGFLRKASSSVKSSMSSVGNLATGGGSAPESDVERKPSGSGLGGLFRKASSSMSGRVGGLIRGGSSSSREASAHDIAAAVAASGASPVPIDDDDDGEDGDDEEADVDEDTPAVFSGAAAQQAAAVWAEGGVPFVVERCPAPQDAASASGLAKWARTYSRMKISKRRLARLSRQAEASAQ